MCENNIIKLRKLSPDDNDICYMWRNGIAVMCTTSPALDIYIRRNRKIRHYH